MANNPYVNKVVYGNSTVMDISDTTAEESDVANGKTFYKASGAKGVGTAVTPDISNCYQSTDNQETDIQDADYFPFYDSSATAKRNTLWSNIKAKLKTYFDTLYATFLGVSGLIETTVGWSTKNILNCDIASGTQTINGLTVNVSRTTGGDLIYVKVSGTATATTDIEVASSVSDNEYGELSGNAYILNGCPSGGSSTTYSLLLRGSYGSGAQDTGSGALISGTVVSGKVYIRIYNGYTASNLQFKPMIRSRYVADDTYEAYHNNVKDELAKKANTSAIPTSLSQLSGDSTHRVVTDAEKATWNGKVSESLLKDTVGWVGKNLLEIPSSVTTQEINGVTFTVTRNVDGEVTEIDANGTATADSNFNLVTNENSDLSSFVDKPFILSGCPAGGSYQTYGLQLYRSSNMKVDFGDGVNVEIAQSDLSLLRFRIFVINGQTVNHLKFYPMLRDASITDDTYEPYHASVEQTLRDAEVIEGKNLFSVVDSAVTPQTETLYSKTTTGYRVYNTTANTYRHIKVFLDLPQNTDLILTTSMSVTSGMGMVVMEYSDDNTNWANGNWTGNPDASSTNKDYVLNGNTGTHPYWRMVLFSTRGTSAVGDITYSNIMFRLASETDPTFEPYYIPLKDGKVSYSIMNKVGAKNILDISNAVNASNVVSSVATNGYITFKDVTARWSSTYIGKFTVKASDVIVISSTASLTYGRIGLSNTASHAPGSGYDPDLTMISGSGLVRVLKRDNKVSVYRANSNQTVYAWYCSDDDYSEYHASFTVGLMIRFSEYTDDTYVPYAMTNREITEELAVQESALTDIASGITTVNTNKVLKSGKFVQLMFNVTGVTLSAGDVMGKIPSEYRPVSDLVIACMNTNGVMFCDVMSGGNMKTKNALTGVSCQVYATWITD